MFSRLYQPSGIVPFGALAPAVLSIASMLPLALLYTWLILHLPVLPGFLLPFVFAFVLAALVKHVCIAGKVRNPRWMGRFGLLLGLCGWYLQWAAWLAMQSGNEQDMLANLGGALHAAVRPVRMSGEILLLGLGSDGVDRYMSFAAWSGELGLLLFVPFFSGKMRAEAVFDESSGEWAAFVESPKKFKPVAQSDLLDLTVTPSAPLSNLLIPETDENRKEFVRLRVYRCQDEDPLVSLVTVELREQGGGERVVECSPGRYLRVPEAELEQLLDEAPPSAQTEAADPPELTEAIALLQAEQFQAACEKAMPFVTADDARLYCDANRICAIACSQSAQWMQALGWWKALFARETTAHNALQVASSLVMVNEVEQGIAWMERAQKLNAVSLEIPGVTIATTMVSALIAASHLQAALPILEQLRDCYAQLHVTDPTFLFIRKMPAFHVFLEKSGAVVKQVLGQEACTEWYCSMLPHLDEPGRAELLAWLDGASVPA